MGTDDLKVNDKNLRLKPARLLLDSDFVVPFSGIISFVP
jgi:hypothetical protein